MSTQDIVYFAVGYVIGLGLYLAAFYAIGEALHRRKWARRDAEAARERRLRFLIDLWAIEQKHGKRDLLTDAERAELGAAKS